MLKSSLYTIKKQHHLEQAYIELIKQKWSLNKFK